MFLISHLKERKRSSTGRLSFIAWTKQQIVQTLTVSMSLEQKAGLQAVSKQKQLKSFAHSNQKYRLPNTAFMTLSYSKINLLDSINLQSTTKI